LETADQGSIHIEGGFDFDAEKSYTDSEIRAMRLKMGLVFQSFNLFPQYTALDNIALPLQLRTVEKIKAELPRGKARRAAISAAEAALLEAENQLSYTIITAPFNGKAGKASVSPFNYVTPSSGALVSVVHLDELYVNFWVSAKDYLTMFGSYDELKKNADIKIILADDSVYPAPAEVIFLDNRIDKDTDTIRIRGLVKNKDLRLIPDSLVTVILSRKEKTEVPAVPASAIMNDGKKDFVYVVTADNTVVLRPVLTGELQGNMQIIRKGLNIGDTIVTEGTHKVIPDGKSKIVPVMDK
jgi:RND family efflux transporter MFP subunit